VLRTSGPTSDEVTGGWRKLHNEELHNFYFSPSIMTKSWRMRWVRHVARMRLRRNAYMILEEQKERDNIKMALSRDRMGWHALN
jgi:hypothetical protein